MTEQWKNKRSPDFPQTSSMRAYISELPTRTIIKSYGS
jgi:hypothetical protein